MKYDIVIENKKYVVEVDSSNASILESSELEVDSSDLDDFDDMPDFDFSDDEDQNVTSLQSPIFGTILDIRVKSGDTVRKDEVLLIIESMKMENEVLSTTDGYVEKVLVHVGDSVKKGQKLLLLGLK